MPRSDTGHLVAACAPITSILSPCHAIFLHWLFDHRNATRWSSCAASPIYGRAPTPSAQSLESAVHWRMRPTPSSRARASTMCTRPSSVRATVRVLGRCSRCDDTICQFQTNSQASSWTAACFDSTNNSLAHIGGPWPGTQAHNLHDGPCWNKKLGSKLLRQHQCLVDAAVFLCLRTCPLVFSLYLCR